MLCQKDIEQFCAQRNYDIRASRNGRWIDQKCTADVITVVADCILNYQYEHKDHTFTTQDIWHFEYTVENVEAFFRKPGVESSDAQHEYDKFFQQPMEMFAYAGVLTKQKSGNRNLYQIADLDVLQYIALRERNALAFLKTYIEKVLLDSGIYNLFETFFISQSSTSFINMKKGFADFTTQHTNINGQLECNRIFTKVLNPLAYFNRAKGAVLGRLSKHPITYDMLVYNRHNFRDLYSNKPKGVTRKEFASEYTAEAKEAYYHYQSTKAKRFLKIFNDQFRNGKAEHLDGIHIQDQATHMHHIFPEAIFPEICHYLENIIALTPTQHLNYAHPNGHTQEIDDQYQQLLLLSKADRIKENLTSYFNEPIYDFANFIFVLFVGLNNHDVLQIESMDFSSVIKLINTNYTTAR